YTFLLPLIIPPLLPSPLFPYTTLFRSGLISAAQFGNALINLEKEIIKSPGKFVLSFNNSVTTDALGLIVKHSINSTDAVLLQVADRKSTRLNSSHDQISYAVFCLKKKI